MMLTDIQLQILHITLRMVECSKIDLVKALKNLPGEPYGSLMQAKSRFDEELPKIVGAGWLDVAGPAGTGWREKYENHFVTEVGIDAMLRHYCGGDQDWRPSESLPEDFCAM